MSETEDIKSALRHKSSGPKKPSKLDLLSTGSTMLNLACSGQVHGGFAKGQYILLVGDTDSGKTWLSLTCLAEASINPEFDDYRLIHDNAEHGALMDMGYFFGDRLVKRLEPPRMDKDGDPIHSRTIEEFYYNVDDALKDGRPFIWVLDSVDVLSSDPEEKKFQENKAATRKGKDPKGSYGDAKAKINAANLRKVVGGLERSGSILVIINQTRDNLDPGLFAPKKTRSGGWALEFYSHLVLWSSVGGQLKRTVRGKDLQVGVISRVRVKRSRMTGRKRVVDVPIYHSCGIDDVGSCVSYLVNEGTWKSKAGVVEVKGLGPTYKAKTEEVIRSIGKDHHLVADLRQLVADTWNEIESACKVERRNPYTS